MTTDNSLLRQHADDAASLKQDFSGLMEDAEREKAGERIRYAVDQSEIYSYVFPERTSQPLRIFSDDEDKRTVAVQHYVLNKLFRGLTHEVVLLPPYALELRAFANRLWRRGFETTVSMLPELLQQARKVVKSPEFADVETLVNTMQRGEE